MLLCGPPSGQTELGSVVGRTRPVIVSFRDAQVVGDGQQVSDGSCSGFQFSASSQDALILTHLQVALLEIANVVEERSNQATDKRRLGVILKM